MMLKRISLQRVLVDFHWHSGTSGLKACFPGWIAVVKPDADEILTAALTPFD
jgi:hypothetical protein